MIWLIFIVTTIVIIVVAKILPDDYHTNFQNNHSTAQQNADLMRHNLQQELNQQRWTNDINKQTWKDK